MIERCLIAGLVFVITLAVIGFALASGAYLAIKLMSGV